MLYTANKNLQLALTRWLTWLEHYPTHQNVAGLTPGLWAWAHMPNRCFSLKSMVLSQSPSLPLSPPLSLKSINISSGEDILKTYN